MAEGSASFIALYVDEDVTAELAAFLRDRGFNAQTTAEADMLNANDAAQLAYAAGRGMAVITYNVRDYLLLARQYAEAGQPHAGIIVSAEQYGRRQFGVLQRLVLRLLNSLSADDMRNRVVYLQQFK